VSATTVSRTSHAGSSSSAGKTSSKGGYFHAVGRRKSSVARAYLKEGDGKITVNGKGFQEYFGRQTLQMVVMQPLVALEQTEKYTININVAGGGPSGQAGATRHAIARALLKVSGEFRPTMKKNGYLTRDAREVERKKYGRHKARKRPQYSKR